MGTHILKNGSRMIGLPQITDERGSLTYLEGTEHVPFEIKRVYYIYDVPDGQIRGEHAHLELEQVLIAVSGEFDVLVDDGRSSSTVTLESPDRGLYLTGLTWREMTRFSECAVCLVLASEHYEEDDYVHDYETFCQLVDNNA